MDEYWIRSKDEHHGHLKTGFEQAVNDYVGVFDIINEGFTLALLNVQHPKMLEYIISRQEIITEYSKSWKMIPSHCDLASHNITIQNGHPILLDLAPHKVGFVPAFFLPMCLIHSEAKEYGRFDLVNAYLNHELDVELSSLFGKEINNFDKNSYIDLLLAETLILAAIDSKIVPQNIQYFHINTKFLVNTVFSPGIK